MKNLFHRYRRVVKLLKKELPPALVVKVRRVKLKGFDGLCIRERKSFLILINRELDESMAIETLLHEWAHARSWTLLHDQLENDAFQDFCHNAMWGVAYSEVYRCYEASLPKKKLENLKEILQEANQNDEDKEEEDD